MISHSEKWYNPSVREENAHLNFKDSKVVYTAEHLGTVLDSDLTLGYLKKRYRVSSDKPYVKFFQLNTVTGIKSPLTGI